VDHFFLHNFEILKNNVQSGKRSATRNKQQSMLYLMLDDDDINDDGRLSFPTYILLSLCCMPI